MPPIISDSEFAEFENLKKQQAALSQQEAQQTAQTEAQRKALEAKQAVYRETAKAFGPELAAYHARIDAMIQSRLDE